MCCRMCVCSPLRIHLSPLAPPDSRCRITAGVYPTTCPFPRVFDHNAVAVTGLLVVAALAAEAALRLMAAGNGARGYVEIP